ncbi:hypothetical protein Bbelb_170140 [Branchiostoma belcheri]|nr:hypothetical protein Bbelb_170140 [Branchiostoma belcheri]
MRLCPAGQVLNTLRPAVMTPVGLFPTPIKRSVRDMKEAIEANICPAPSDPSVVVSVAPVLALPDADNAVVWLSENHRRRLVPFNQPNPSLFGDSAGETTDPAAGDLLREVVDKVILKAQKPGRSRSSSLPPTPKLTKAAERGPSRSLDRLDDAEKPYRSRSLPSRASAGVKPQKVGRSRSLGRLDDVDLAADFLKSDLLPTLFLEKAEAGKASVSPHYEAAEAGPSTLC